MKVWYETKKSGLLLIRFRYEGKRYTLTTGLHDSEFNRSAADRIIARIKTDIGAGYFDPTLLKYKPQRLGAKPTSITAVELFSKYFSFVQRDRENGLAPGSIGRYKAIIYQLEICLGKMPAAHVTEAIARKAATSMSKPLSRKDGAVAGVEPLSKRTVKTYLFALRACWDWAAADSKYHLTPTVNPWAICIEKLGSIAPTQPKKPFTVDELQAIFKAFDNHPKYCHYVDYARFLTLTSTRPGESNGLRWRHLINGFKTAWIGESISRSNRKTTKTGKARYVPLVASLQMVLTDRYTRLQPEPDDLVFPNANGLPIDDTAFIKIWKRILMNCCIDYRSPYQLRHTGISMSLHHGANPIALAEMTGHDKRVMLSTYSHAINQDCLMVDIPLN
jgi:integrase